jgi:hypothetical protein
LFRLLCKREKGGWKETWTRETRDQRTRRGHKGEIKRETRDGEEKIGKLPHNKSGCGNSSKISKSGKIFFIFINNHLW